MGLLGLSRVWVHGGLGFGALGLARSPVQGLIRVKVQGLGLGAFFGAGFRDQIYGGLRVQGLGFREKNIFGFAVNSSSPEA